MRVLDLFAGTGSATAEFERRGHDVFRIELDARFEAELHADVLTVSPWDIDTRWGRPDFIWASPPCTSFSVGSFRHHWHAATRCVTCGAPMHRSSYERWFHAYNPVCTRAKAGPLGYEPKSETGVLGRRLLRRTLRIIHELEPAYWIIENPRALMRKMPELRGIERRTITHCQYGDPRRMKPTDLFGVFPPGFEARCCTNGAPCHEAAPRGARTGTQGLNSKDAAMLPPGLSVELCDAMEAALVRQEVA